MRPTGHHSWLVVFLVLLVAGCAGNGAAELRTMTSTAPAPDPHAPEPVVTSDTGSISGQVLDDELVAIPDASIARLSDNQTVTQTAQDGTFTLNGLAPGNIDLFIQATGYNSKAIRVLVKAAQVVDAHVTLVPLPIPEPYADNWQHNGYMEIGLGTPVLSPRTGPNANWGGKHDLKLGVATTLSSMQWTPASALSANRFRLVIDIGGDGKFDQPHTSPIIFRLDEPNVTKPTFLRHDVLVPVTCDPVGAPTSCAGLPPKAAVDPVYGQRFTIYVTAYYVDPPAPDATNLPD